jgi:hypothetical protein
MWYRANEAAEARIARGMLIAFAAISLVGVPTQDVLATLMFWTAAFFYIASVPASFAPALVPADAGEASGAFGKRAVVAMSLLLAVYTPLSLWRATTTLRVPVRAQRVGWPYVYGFYDSEPDGSGGFQRWTTDHGVIVFEAPTRHMLLTVRPNALAERRSRDPMRLRLEVNREVVLDREVVSAAPVEKYVDLTGKPQRVMIEARVNRTFRPSTAGLEDTRDLGLLLQWKFMDHPPANANVERGSDR